MTTAELSGLEFLRLTNTEKDRPVYIGTLLGLSIDELEFGQVTMSLKTRPEFANPLGTLHGGICATLLDSAMGCAVHTTLEAGVGYGTLELKVNYIRSVPVDGVRLIATANTIHLGRQTATAEGRVHDPDGRLVAHGTTTCIIHR
jgi:uncharacterized protein (TIGR00369 family)